MSFPVRATAVAGLLGALTMFVGDMLFYGQVGSGADALNSSLAVVSQRPPSWLMLGGLVSSLAGLGYMAGVVHVWQRAEPAPRVLRFGLTLLVAAIFSVAIATHAVWGAFALAAGRDPKVAAYLELFFTTGMVVAVPTGLLLAGLVLTGRTTWPRWSAALNPGLLYVVLSTAAWLPSPIGAAVVGGAFNLAFAVFFATSTATARDI